MKGHKSPESPSLSLIVGCTLETILSAWISNSFLPIGFQWKKNLFWIKNKMERQMVGSTNIWKQSPTSDNTWKCSFSLTHRNGKYIASYKNVLIIYWTHILHTVLYTYYILCCTIIQTFHVCTILWYYCTWIKSFIKCVKYNQLISHHLSHTYKF